MSGRWVIGEPGHLGPGDALIALDLDELRAAGPSRAVAFHDALSVPEAVEPRSEVVVHVPRWRGHGFLAVLEWLVRSALAGAGATVTWQAERRGGATGLRRLLGERGWTVERRLSSGRELFVGPPPDDPPGDLPAPDQFEADVLGRRLVFACGWGTFSAGHLDEGTKLLIGEAARLGPLDCITDVGTGYGPVAIALAAGPAGAARATDTDSVALALARRNAAAAALDVDIRLEDDPLALPRSSLTTCALPTHIARSRADRLVAALAGRAMSEPVLVAVHASLEERYASALGRAGAGARAVARAQHVVLRAG